MYDFIFLYSENHGQEAVFMTVPRKKRGGGGTIKKSVFIFKRRIATRRSDPCAFIYPSIQKIIYITQIKKSLQSSQGSDLQKRFIFQTHFS